MNSGKDDYESKQRRFRVSISASYDCRQTCKLRLSYTKSSSLYQGMIEKAPIRLSLTVVVELSVFLSAAQYLFNLFVR